MKIPALYMDAKSTQSAGVYDLLAWLEHNWKKVVIGAVGVVIVVTAIAIYSWQQREAEQAANKALLAATAPAQGRLISATPDELSKVAQQYANTSAGDRAQLLTAGAFFEKGDYAKAQAQFEAVAKSGADDALKAQAAYGVAASLEAQKNYDQAIQRYQEVVRQFPHRNVAPQAKLAIARIHENQGKPEEALKIYSEIETGSDASFEYWQGEAAERKERLVSRHPQLRKEAAAAPFEQIIEVTTPPAPADPNP